MGARVGLRGRGHRGDSGRHRGDAAVPSGAGWSGRGQRAFPREPLEGARGPPVRGPVPSWPVGSIPGQRELLLFTFCY